MACGAVCKTRCTLAALLRNVSIVTCMHAARSWMTRRRRTREGRAVEAQSPRSSEENTPGRDCERSKKLPNVTVFRRQPNRPPHHSQSQASLPDARNATQFFLAVSHPAPTLTVRCFVNRISSGMSRRRRHAATPGRLKNTHWPTTRPPDHHNAPGALVEDDDGRTVSTTSACSTCDHSAAAPVQLPCHQQHHLWLRHSPPNRKSQPSSHWDGHRHWLLRASAAAAARSSPM